MSTPQALEAMTVDDLRALASEYGLPTRNTRKQDLIDSILAAQAADETPTPHGLDAVDTNTMRDVSGHFSQPAPLSGEPEEPGTPAPELQASQYWRVVQKSRVVQDGLVHTLHQDSIVSAASHDLDALRAQGIALEPCGPPELPRDDYGEIAYAPGRELQKPPPPVPLHASYVEERVLVLPDGTREIAIDDDSALSPKHHSAHARVKP